MFCIAGKRVTIDSCYVKVFSLSEKISRYLALPAVLKAGRNRWLHEVHTDGAFTSAISFDKYVPARGRLNPFGTGLHR